MIIFLIFFAYASFICIFLLMYDCTQGKKVTCLLKPGVKTGKNHSLNDVNLKNQENWSYTLKIMEV
jgi:hypothetical protein